MAKSIIHLEDIKSKTLSKYENCYIELKPKFKKELFEEAMKLSPGKSLYSLSKILDVKSATLWASKDRGSIPLTLLIKLSNLLTSKGYKKFSLRNLEKHIEFIKGGGATPTKIYKPKFPFDLETPAGIRILSKMYHDGGIKSNGQSFYCNADIALLTQFYKDVEAVFGKMKLKIAKSRYCSIVCLPHLISAILEIAGVHKGGKVINNPSPPSWIEDVEKNLIIEFIRSAMDDEGCMGERQITMNIALDIDDKLTKEEKEKLISLPLRQRTNTLKSYIGDNPIEFIPNILMFDKNLIEKLGIKVREPELEKCYINKEDRLRAIWKIAISSKKNLQKFHEEIGFKIKRKQEKLKDYLENTKFIAEDGKKLINIVRTAWLVEKENGHFTFKTVANKLGYDHKYVGRLINEGERKNFIKRLGKENRRLKFILTSNGRQEIEKSYGP